ncbi:TetR family transcriptional regulator [Mycolicibacterium xanthum]|uniref:TetR family transcriptional regulator n=1 Tax=Mycolicibacterium xanthum TaxID=2796469 RepID=UPI0027E13381|nr:TetR family transcriptional regulator [Mycolicibacterium xanthum]
MDVVSEGKSAERLTARKQRATKARIAAAAAQAVADHGLAGATVEQIAAAAEVGRATFFRYFSAKEDAVADGMTTRWLDVITAAIAAQPPELAADEAVLAAFGTLGDGFGAISDQVRELATLTRSSPVFSAWTLQIYLRYETAIADLLAGRFADPVPDDPRPRLLGAVAMASVRIALDDWLVHGGSLPGRVRAALVSIRLV